jgi:hypothetical protein
MIDILRFDLMVRAGTLSLLALLMAILVRDHRRTLPGRLAVLMIIGVACHVIAEIPETVPLNSPSDLIVSIGEASQFGTFWLFCRAWFNDEARIGWRSILIVLFAMALSLTNMWLWQELKHGYWPTDLAMRLVWLGLTSAGLWIAWKGRNNDLIEARRRLRIWFVGTTPFHRTCHRCFHSNRDGRALLCVVRFAPAGPFCRNKDCCAAERTD